VSLLLVLRFLEGWVNLEVFLLMVDQLLMFFTPGGPAGAQRLTTLKNAQTMADALNAYLPTVRKFSEQAKKDDFERNMASAGIKQNIATNAQMLAAAQAAGLGMGLTGAQQAGQALTQQYNY
jgi:hypothetical protein